tara:strand:+ start:41 stop:217 length:177 start_codon:yes stop_codon:yes gene_type:complete
MKKYQVHFGKAYPLHLGYDKDYHRIKSYSNKKLALKCLNRANNCKWIEWTDLIIKEKK